MDFIPLSSRPNKRMPFNNSRGAVSKPVVSHHQSVRKAKMPRLQRSNLDRVLMNRIRRYLEDNAHLDYIDLDKMAEYLHRTHPEYKRRKIKVFKTQVQESFNEIKANVDDDSDESEATSSSPKKKGEVIDLVQEEEEEDVTMVLRKGGGSTSGMTNHLKRVHNIVEELNSPAKRLKIDLVIKDEPDNDEVLSQVKGSTLNASLSDLYAKKDPSLENGVASAVPKHLISDPEPSAKSSRASSPAKATPGTKKSLTKRKEVQVSVAKTTFKDIGGCEDTIKDIFAAARHLALPQNYKQLGVTPPRGCLLHGPPGCGKSLMAQAVSGSLRMPMMTVSGTELISGISGDSESRIRSLFDQAKVSAPCILFIDNVEIIAKKKENAQKDMEVRILSQLLACLDDLDTCESEQESRVFIIGSTDRLEAVDPALRTGRRLEREIPMGIPDATGRQKILEVMCKDFNLSDDVQFHELAKLTPGFVGSDLKALITAAASSAENRHFQACASRFTNSNGDDFETEELMDWIRDDEKSNQDLDDLRITFDDFKESLKVVSPSAMKEGFATVPNVSFEDIGALDDIRHELEMAICVPVQHPEVVQRLGLDVPSGVLLCGPPGCGKTLLAKAVANQAGINFISVKGPEIMNMYVGESERAVRQVFQRARNSAPCVIFFDEIDSICPRRSGHDGGSGTNRIVNQLLTEMDGVEGRKGVYVMGATNRVDMIDEAILRPGRLTSIFFVDLPTSEGRVEILKKLTKNGSRPKLAATVNLTSLGSSERCDGFSGADLSNLVRRAAQFKMEEICQESNPNLDAVEVEARHFDKAFDFIKPSVSGKQRKKYEIMKHTYSSGKLPTQPPIIDDDSAPAVVAQ